ncbi:hypothetical protein PAXRUDRAFT_34612 [Paxillus rubicundulus Ve08.2h10]|uniref:Uncharacterized protein n=1 Tax=Paxillus rubicundulus Ve08.2h10 TaxID=930991 RepID=A0A0D0DZ78_9AGAM|nr:hypothetical protein PAXRUDRAFT_34612 [Paxillus rubicundulus Ve08.2h10]
MSSDTRRLLEAASALSQLLRMQSIPHAFHGNILSAVMSDSPRCDEIFCIVEGGPTHPFRRVRQAIAGNEHFTTTHSPWSNRLLATYRRLIPAIEIEILPAGEHGPRRLDSSTTMNLKGVPFLTLSEFVRDKLKAWSIRGSDRDANDIIYTLCRYWNRLDINRVPEHDMNHFVTCHRAAALSWTALKKKYGM